MKTYFQKILIYISFILFGLNHNSISAQSNFLDSLLSQPFKTGLEDIYPKPPLAILKSVRVKVRSCVDRNGNVISTEFLPKESTTYDNTLIEIALKNAKEWKFNPSKREKQCGTIDYDFKTYQ